MNLKPYPEYKDSGVAWLGEVHPLKRYAKNIINNVISKNSDELYIALEHIESWTGRFKKNRYAKFTGQVKKFSETDVLFGKLRPYLAKVVFPKEQGVCVGEILAIRPNGKYLLGSFLEKSFLSFHFIGIVNGATYGSKMPRAEWDFIGNLGFTILPIPEQLTIARFLDYKTAQIARFLKAKKRMIELLKEQKQVIINDAVTGKIDVTTVGAGSKPALSRKMKDSGVEWLYQVPEGWEIVKIKQISKVISKGTTPSTEGREILEKGNIRFYKAENIVDGILTDKPLCFIDDATNNILKRSQLQENDVLFVIAGATIGKVAVLDKKNIPANTNQAVAFIRPNIKVIPRYMSSWLQSGVIKQIIWLNAVQSAQPNLSMTKLGNILIPLPSIVEQESILRWILLKTTAINLTISRTEREIALMQEYRTRLISDVVTGKIDVREITVTDIADILDIIDEPLGETEGEKELETSKGEE